MQHLTTKPAYIKTADEILKLGIKKVTVQVVNLLIKNGVEALKGSINNKKSNTLLILPHNFCRGVPAFLGTIIQSMYGSVLLVCKKINLEDQCFQVYSFTFTQFFKNLNKK